MPNANKTTDQAGQQLVAVSEMKEKTKRRRRGWASEKKYWRPVLE